MPERFEIYIVYKRRYINTLPFLFPFPKSHNVIVLVFRACHVYFITNTLTYLLTYLHIHTQ